MPKLFRARCGATKTSADASRSAFSRVVDQAVTDAVGRKRPGALPGHYHLEVWDGPADRRQRGQQHVQTLPRLIGAAEEEQP